MTMFGAEAPEGSLAEYPGELLCREGPLESRYLQAASTFVKNIFSAFLLFS
jgi:hypothetical protein